MADKAKATRIDHVRNNRTRCHFEIRRIKPGMSRDLFFFRLNKQLCGNNKTAVLTTETDQSSVLDLREPKYVLCKRTHDRKWTDLDCRRIQLLVVEFTPPLSPNRPPMNLIDPPHPYTQGEGRLTNVSSIHLKS